MCYLLSGVAHVAAESSLVPTCKPEEGEFLCLCSGKPTVMEWDTPHTALIGRYRTESLARDWVQILEPL